MKDDADWFDLVKKTTASIGLMVWAGRLTPEARSWMEMRPRLSSDHPIFILTICTDEGDFQVFNYDDPTQAMREYQQVLENPDQSAELVFGHRLRVEDDRLVLMDGREIPTDITLPELLPARIDH